MSVKIMKNRERWGKVSALGGSILLLLAVFGAGYQTATYSKTTPSEKTSAKLQSLINQDLNKPQTVSFGTFWEAWGVVDNYFYDKVDKQDRVGGAISGMLASLGDPYTVYLPKEENDLFQTDLSGKFSGIGAEISQINGYPTIVTPLSGSPAEQAGAKPKDIILKVDDLETLNENFAKVINKIRGEKGTVVTLTILREGEEQPFELKITRDEIELPSVTSEVKSEGDLKYGYLKISQFLEDTEPQVEKAIVKFNKEGVTKLVIDVRNNPGGLLNVAIDVSSLFVDTAAKPEFDNVIVWQKDRNQNTTSYRATKKPLAIKFKTVVLQNEGSASAAEIFAGALRDYGRAELVGTKSFGKGSVQELHDLSDGSSVKVTIAKWLTPNKSEIDKHGIEPNVKVEPASDNSDESVDVILQKGLERLR